jgi:glucose-6-phosphate 1-dehydrogenase
VKDQTTDLIPDDTVVVIFGANGDLSKRKLLPALYHLHVEGLLPRQWRIVGNARSEVSDEEFRDIARQAVEDDGRATVDPEEWDAFADRLSFASCEFNAEDIETLAGAVERAEAEIDGSPRRLFYLSTPPSTFGPITEGLGKSDLKERARVVYEKPFGVDPEDFLELDQLVRGVLDEEQIYRIDHFLGKESVQNILALRFANGMFEAMWNRAHIDHVQIDVPEELGIGSRAGFYEKTGALRDMLVTHLFQVLSVVAMEPPSTLEQGPLIDEKVKVFESMRELEPDDVVLGQYEGYRDADGVADDSQTDTFVAARVFIDNWRWDGVPFFLRTGKRLAQKRQTVTLAFRRPPSTMFRGVKREGLDQDHLTFELAGEEGVSLSFLAKQPGPTIELGRATMAFNYEKTFGSELIEAYERLIHDALLGDRTLFTRADGIGRTWEIVSAILDNPPPIQPYAQDSWGPQAAEDLIAPRRWHLPDD